MTSDLHPSLLPSPHPLPCVSIHLSVSYTDKCMTDSTTDDKGRQSMIRALFNYKTPITWGIPEGDAAPFLKQHQWEVINHWTPADIRDQYLRDDNGEAFGESTEWFYMVHAKSIR